MTPAPVLPRCRRRALALLLGGWLVFLAAEAAPHLVHHLFDSEDEAACEFLATADHAPAALAAVDTVQPTLRPAEPLPLLGPPRAPASEGPRHAGRGPPPSPPALT
ncbi:MAG TPA: hypothetical protein VGX21_21130 [Methylomirabilota bacterium]|jgi:hypothetical protein|nr:hypothetical protein [Methylomirabilota bacterium]